MTLASKLDPALQASMQADVLLLLAWLFRQPSEETAQRLQFAVDLHDELLISAASRNKVAWCLHLGKAARQLESPGVRRVRDSHDRLFLGPTHCPIHETAYVGRDADEVLADVAGFYQSFGFEPRLGLGERADHLASELEFLAMLLVRMSGALGQGRSHGAEVCARALRSFGADHPGKWWPSFCDRLEETADLPYHDSAAQLLRHAWDRFSSRYMVTATQ